MIEFTHQGKHYALTLKDKKPVYAVITEFYFDSIKITQGKEYAQIVYGIVKKLNLV